MPLTDVKAGVDEQAKVLPVELQELAMVIQSLIGAKSLREALAGLAIKITFEDKGQQ